MRLVTRIWPFHRRDRFFVLLGGLKPPHVVEKMNVVLKRLIGKRGVNDGDEAGEREVGAGLTRYGKLPIALLDRIERIPCAVYKYHDCWLSYYLLQLRFVEHIFNLLAG